MTTMDHVNLELLIVDAVTVVVILGAFLVRQCCKTYSCDRNTVHTLKSIQIWLLLRPCEYIILLLFLLMETASLLNQILEFYGETWQTTLLLIELQLILGL